MTHAIAAFGALAQDTRLAAFRRLVHAGPDGLAAGDLARALAVPPPTLSFHLRQLLGAGLVTVRRDGRSWIYQPDFERVEGVLAWLMENCCSDGGCS